eukprot:Skav221541  [mRNA]  locus=scaffold1813:168543:172608:+ [translate_table: standard]
MLGRTRVQWTAASVASLGMRGALPDSLQSMKFHGNGEFQRYDMGEELINGLFSGIAIATPISFLVLLCSTQNIVVAIYAVLSVGAIVLCVLGFCKSAMDWDLGVGEAIAGVIVIGYSVDYVVHLAHMYCEGKHFGHNTRHPIAASGEVQRVTSRSDFATICRQFVALFKETK